MFSHLVTAPAAHSFLSPPLTLASLCTAALDWLVLVPKCLLLARLLLPRYCCPDTRAFSDLCVLYQLSYCNY